VVGTSNGPQYLPINDTVHLIFQGFDGLPVIHSQYFGYSNYIETAMYVGVIPLVLAVTAVIVHWKRPEVRSFSILAVVMGLLVFVPSLASILDKVVDAYWLFALQPMILALAVLSGMGTDSVIRSQHDLRARKLLGIGFLVAAALLVVIWLTAERGLSPQQANIRAHSFIWPAIEVVVGLVVVFGLMKLPEGTPSGRSRWAISSGSIAGVVLLATEAAFLVTAGAPLMSSSGSYLTATPAEAQLERAVGSSLVGFGESTCLNFLPGVGILENVNVVFRIREFAVYDPMTPRAYFSGWRKSPGYPNASVFCPAITSATIARRFGVSYVLEPPGHPGPTGGVFYKDVGNEGLYHIPGSAVATLVSVRAGSPFPAVAANGTPVPVSNLDSSSWKIVIDTTHPDVLRLRLTDVPGWHASIDGRPLQLYRFNRIMLQAHVPPGRHVIELSYWPTTFSIGLVLAALSAVALALLLVTGAIRARTGADRTTATNRAESAGQLV
jgi:hypothetical protein